jgi:hypothetical protein
MPWPLHATSVQGAAFDKLAARCLVLQHQLEARIRQGQLTAQQVEAAADDVDLDSVQFYCAGAGAVL